MGETVRTCTLSRNRVKEHQKKNHGHIRNVIVLHQSTSSLRITRKSQLHKVKEATYIKIRRSYKSLLSKPSLLHSNEKILDGRRRSLNSKLLHQR